MDELDLAWFEMSPAHRYLFVAILELTEDDEPVSLTGVVEALRDPGFAERIKVRVAELDAQIEARILGDD
jgi:replicative DNA helicase